MALAETPHGKYFYFAPDDIGKEVASGKFWNVHYRPWIDCLGSDDVMVDVGANIGFFTIYPALRGVWVWAFEPSPECFDLLRRNVEMNEVELNVRLENVALYDREVEMSLNPEWNDWPKLGDGRVDYEHHTNSGGMSLVPGESKIYKICSRTLDSYELMKCSLIKTDTQGADLRVLVGARKTIQKYRPVICFEIEPMPARLHGDSVESYMRFFQEMNYSVVEVSRGASNIDYVAEPK